MNTGVRKFVVEALAALPITPEDIGSVILEAALRAPSSAAKQAVL